MPIYRQFVCYEINSSRSHYDNIRTFQMAGLGCNTHHKDRWNYFFGFLKERGIPQETSPIDYPEDILKTFQAIMYQGYRDANN
jgi:hypothetical protein